MQEIPTAQQPPQTETHVSTATTHVSTTDLSATTKTTTFPQTPLAHYRHHSSRVSDRCHWR